MKWRIERVGGRSNYGRGWIAFRAGYGAWCATWAEAIEFVDEEIRRARIA